MIDVKKVERIIKAVKLQKLEQKKRLYAAARRAQKAK